MSNLQFAKPSAIDLPDDLRKSYEFWNQVYRDSHLNIPLIWKKALQSNSENIKQIEKIWKQTSPQNFELELHRFLDLWSDVIKESRFEISRELAVEFGQNLSNAQSKAYFKILKLLEQYWEGVQNKSIE